MKKQGKKTVALICVLIMVLCNIGTAFADAGINNTIIGQGNNSACPTLNSGSAYQRGRNMIMTTGEADNMTLPNPGSYLETPESMYVNAPRKNSIYSYLTPWKDKEKLGKCPYHGAKVLVVAEQDGFDCILFRDNKNRLHASWVYASELTWYFPGIEQTIGTPCVSYANDQGNITVHWSKERFVNSGQHYTILDETARNCIQFTLDYQVIARNGARTSEVLGDRVVYVNDGSGWTAVGWFSYPETDATHVVVNLDHPTDLIAVATVACCDQPDTFLFRQSVLDVLTVTT